jgi:hypothetical protein
MNCHLCRLSLLEDLADAASDLLDRAWPEEECFNPETFGVDGDDYRKLDFALAKLQEFEEYEVT